MPKNIVIFSMSPYHSDATVREYTAENGKFRAQCEHTNETALKYIDWKLSQENQRVDRVYAFLTDKVRRETLPRFQETFYYYPFFINGISLHDNGSLDGSFQSVCTMFDHMREYIDKNRVSGEEVVIHFDMTGGLRHSAVLMLSLMQMLPYAGAKQGMVLYTNFSTGQVENASALMDMFTLISGAEAFIQFGSVEQIQKYFSRQENLSKQLNKLLLTMQNVSETIKVCSSYEHMLPILKSLRYELDQYGAYIASSFPALSGQEAFFTKLLPTIEREYSDILPSNTQPCTPPQIIRWCIKKGFLQQAITFYNEWIPAYLLDSGIILLMNNTIRNVCQEKASTWIPWQDYFLQTYTLPTYSKPPWPDCFYATKTLTYKELRYYLSQTQSCAQLLEIVGTKSPKFTAFLHDIEKFVHENKNRDFVDAVLQLPESSKIRKVLQENARGSLTSYLRNSLKRNGFQDIVILESIKHVKKGIVMKLFDLNHEYQAKKAFLTPAEERKVAMRVATFRKLFQQHDIISPFNTETILQFIAAYARYGHQLRNQINHASSLAASKESNTSIASAIINSLDILESANNEEKGGV